MWLVNFRKFSTLTWFFSLWKHLWGSQLIRSHHLNILESFNEFLKLEGNELSAGQCHTLERLTQEVWLSSDGGEALWETPYGNKFSTVALHLLRNVAGPMTAYTFQPRRGWRKPLLDMYSLERRRKLPPHARQLLPPNGPSDYIMGQTAMFYSGS